jgi:hypothetical protein
MLGSVQPLGQSCENNICTMTVGGATVQWTEAANPSGQFKMYIDRIIDDPEITFITLSNTTSAAYNLTDAGTSISGPNPLPYKWLAPSDGPPFYTMIASSKPNPSSTQTFSGHLQMFMAVDMSDAAQVEYPMNLDMYIGSPIENKNFSMWVDSSAPLNEQESEPELPHNSSHYITGTQKTEDEACNDGINNDMANDGMDCADADCSGTPIGRTANGDVIACEVAESTCWDNFDNDNDGSVDCADSDCDGMLGAWLLPNGTIAKWDASAVSGAKMIFCDIPEGDSFYFPPNTSVLSSCVDTFDNNANGAVDCYDTSSCWGKGSRNTSTEQYPCPAFENNAPGWCADGTDNDFDKYVHGSMSAGYGTGADCDDYDCAGSTNCPSNEIMTVYGFTNASQCFDGIDNDLDIWYWNGAAYVRNTSEGMDCEDPDCAWAVNPSNSSDACPASEFNLVRWGFFTTSYNYCDDGADNDYDASSYHGGTDCLDANNSLNPSDTDCWHRFNGCGPCPSTESIAWNSCADGTDNDNDNGSGGYDTSASTGTDCADSDCDGEIGSTANAQRCELGTELNCSDGFDNNRNGATDCSDAACSDRTGPGGVVCGAENTVPACTDNLDNNGNGLIDCIDSSCFGIGECGPATQSGPYIVVPAWTSMTLTPAGDIRANWTSAQHIGESFTIRLQNVQSLSDGSTVIVLGQWPSNNISLNVTADQIVLSGPSSGSFSKSWSNGVLTLENTTAVTTMDLTVDMPIPYDTAYGSETFPILTQSAHGQGNGNIVLTVYEHQMPMIDELEVEPMWPSISVTVRLGDSFAVRAVVNDTGRGDSQIAPFAGRSSMSPLKDCTTSRYGRSTAPATPDQRLGLPLS